MKTWFITGASRGFGARIAEQALARGDNVVATARNPDAVAERLGQHPDLLAVALDVTDEAQIFKPHLYALGCVAPSRKGRSSKAQGRQLPRSRARRQSAWIGQVSA